MLGFLKEFLPFFQDRISKFIYIVLLCVIVFVEALPYLGINLEQKNNYDAISHIENPLVDDYELDKRIQHLRVRNHADWAGIHLFHNDKGNMDIDIKKLVHYKFTRIVESHDDILHSKKRKMSNVPVSQYYTIIKETDEEGIFYVENASSLHNTYVKNLLQNHLGISSIIVIPLYDPENEHLYVGFIMLEYLATTKIDKEELFLIEKDCEYLENMFTTRN